MIEGFYGPPWTAAARLRCIEHLAEWGMSHYVWAAKAEPRHRDRWDEAFTQDELVHFAQLATHRAGVSLAVALIFPAIVIGASYVLASRQIDELEVQVTLDAT